MRSDFYDLPWAAQQAIRQGETDARNARRRANSINELQAENARLASLLDEAERVADEVSGSLQMIAPLMAVKAPAPAFEIYRKALEDLTALLTAIRKDGE